MHVSPLSTRKRSHVWLATKLWYSRRAPKLKNSINHLKYGGHCMQRLAEHFCISLSLSLSLSHTHTHTHTHTTQHINAPCEKVQISLTLRFVTCGFHWSLKVYIYRKFTFLEAVGLKFACHLNGHISCIHSYECL